MDKQALVIGLGSMGQRHLQYMGERAGVSRFGCDRRPETFPDGVPCVQDITQALHCFSPSLVVIALPARYHLETLYQVRQAHPDASILIEKPLSDRPLSDEDKERCLNIGGIVCVGYNWRFHPFAKMLHGVRDAIGDITFHVGSDMRTWPGSDYSDPLREFSHELDLVAYLTSMPQVTDATMTPHGRYVVDGFHSHGRWRVVIAPYHEPVERWVNVEIRPPVGNGRVMTYPWDMQSHTLEAMYRAQSFRFQRMSTVGIASAMDSSRLLCSVSDALMTTGLIDNAEVLLARKDKGCLIM